MSTPLSTTSSPQAQPTTNSILARQHLASAWSVPSPVTVQTDANSCEDLTSFFELAGGLYFYPHIGTGADANGTDHDDGTVQDNDSRLSAGGLDAFQAEDEALTRVMAGLL